MPEIINLTPHIVNVCDEAGNLLERFESSGDLARAQKFDRKIGEITLTSGHNIDLVSTTFGELSGLPDPQEDTYYIVSLVAAQAAIHTERTTADLLIPSNPVRDERGQVIGCRNFAQTLA